MKTHTAIRLVSSAEHEMSTLWVRPNLHCVAKQHRDSCQARCDALEAYLQGGTIRQVSRRYGVNRNTMTTIVCKAFLIAPDGAQFGYRACIPWIGKSDTRKPRRRSKEGAPYALLNLLQDHPDLEVLLHDFKDPIPVGTPPRSFLRLVQRIRALLRDRGYGDQWPFTTPDLGRRAFLRHVRKIRKQRMLSGQPDITTDIKRSIVSLRQLFHPRPYDRFEFDAHKQDVDMVIVLPNAKGELVKYRVSCIWILAIIDVNSTAVMAWKIVFGKAYSALDVAQCFAKAASRWEMRDLVAPGMVYAPGASMPQELGWGCMPSCVTALDNALAHTATLSLEAWVNHHHGIFHFGPAYTPEHRPYIELFFARIEAGAIRALPGGKIPTRTLADSAEASSDHKGVDHPVDIRALEDLFDVIVTGHNVSPIPARQHRSPMEILREYEYSEDFWRLPDRTIDDIKALTSHQRRVTVRGSKTNDKPVHVNVYGVTYRHPSLDKTYDLVGQTLWASIDLEDLRTVTLHDDRFNRIATMMASAPWDSDKHDLTTRRRIQKLSRSGELEIAGALSAVRSYAAYTLSNAHKNSAIVDQAARLTQLAINDQLSAGRAQASSASEEEFECVAGPRESLNQPSFGGSINGYISL